MSINRKVLRRKRGEETDATAEAESSAVTPTLPEPTESNQEAPETPTPVEAAPVREPVPRLDADELMAIASMDPTDLAALMEEGLSKPQISLGDQVTGSITRIGREWVFVDIGAKSEGTLPVADMPDAQIGSQVTAYVMYSGEGGIQLSVKLSGPAAGAFLESAQISGIPVEGKVIGANPGGFDVKVGTTRAFCPISQIDRTYVTDTDQYIGQTLEFKVLETEEKIVLSRKALIIERMAGQAEKFWEEVEEGREYTGVVSSIQTWGVFVDVGGVDGLVPRRELSWGSVDDPNSVVQRGQSLRVSVISVDRDAKKLTLSARNPEQEPWARVGIDFTPGEVYEGVVRGVESFGAFVELGTGLQGLMHISKMKQGAIPKPGETVEVRLLSVDHERRRLSLAPSDAPVEEVEETEGSSVGSEVSGTVQEVLRNGVVVTLEDGRNAWLPGREVDLPSGVMLSQRFRKGRTIAARISEDDRRRNRVTLTQRKSTDDEANRAWGRFAAKQKKQSTSFGTLGDLLSGLKLDN